MNKRTRRLQFNTSTKKRIIERDRQCIFCKFKYNIRPEHDYERSIFDIMHYIPKSQGGLGIEENGVLGCRYHHDLMDNGSRGLRPEMLQMIKEYLQEIYPYWNESELYYKRHK